MKIGIFDPYLDDCGGGEKYMMTIANSLSLNHDVSVFWDNKSDLDAVKKRFSLELKNVSLVPNIFSTKYSFVKRYNLSKKYDAIIFLSDGSIPFLACPTYIHIQRPLNHVKLSPFAKFKLKRVKKVFCNSEFTKEYIDKTFNINSTILYPPVEIHKKDIKKKNEILHVGRFRIVEKSVGVNDYKKQYMMIKVFKEMIDKGLQRWKLIMAVSVKEEDIKDFNMLVESVKEYPIEFKVNLSNRELWDYYSSASIYWHASGYGEDLKTYPERAEHFGISTVEAMGAGTVPVVINNGGQKEIVTDSVNGLLWNDIPEFKEETLILMNSKELLRELSVNAQKRAKDFSLEAFEEKLNEIIYA